MSHYLETDFCSQDDGLDYIFAMMGAIYGATFNRHFEGIDPSIVRSVWKDQVKTFLTYKPSLDFAIQHLNADHPPSAIKFRNLCNSGPSIPVKPVLKIERKLTAHEQIEADRAKAEGLQKLKELKEFYSRKINEL